MQTHNLTSPATHCCPFAVLWNRRCNPCNTQFHHWDPRNEEGRQKFPQFHHTSVRLPHPDTVFGLGRGRMEYQGFVVQAFERELGKWRAKIFRTSGKALFRGRKRNAQFVTGIDAATASAALLVAVKAIDAGAFSQAPTKPERIWRRRNEMRLMRSDQ